VVILEMHKVINIDTTGLDALEALHNTLRRRDGRLILVGLNEQPKSLLTRSGVLEDIGSDNVFDSMEAALRAAAAAPA
jgi:SulP family sulfate permease